MSAAVFWQCVRYGATGVASVSVYIALLWSVLHTTPVPEFIANAAAYCVATLLNYLANYYWSFATMRTHGEAFWRYLAVAFAGISLNGLFVMALFRYGVRIELAALIFAALWPIVSFLSLKLWALR